MLEEFGIINLGTYLLGAIFIVLVPGPNTIYVLVTSAKKGVVEGYKATAAVLLGDSTLVFCAYIGVASIIMASPMLFTMLKYAGGAYLAYLGIKTIYLALKKEFASAEEIKVNKESSFKKGLILSLTNPKVILFMVSFFVQFVDPHYENTGISFFILGLILETFNLLYLSFLIFFGARLAKMFKENKKLAKIGNSLVGALFIGFGAKLVTTTA